MYSSLRKALLTGGLTFAVIIGTLSAYALGSGTDLFALMDKILLDTSISTDGTVKNSDKVDGLHASDILNAAGGGSKTMVVHNFYVPSGNPTQADCPIGWTFLKGWVPLANGGGGNNYGVTCYIYSGGTPDPDLTDKDSDGFTDIDSIAYMQSYNGLNAVNTLKGMDLDSGKYDTSAQKSGVLIYQTSTMTDGNLGGRSGADTFCNNNKPATLSGRLLTNIHAMISVTTTDEIRDMPNNYGYNAYRPIWQYIADGSIIRVTPDWKTLFTDGATKYGTNYGGGDRWSGTTPGSNTVTDIRGDLANNCGGWTTTSGNGRYGYNHTFANPGHMLAYNDQSCVTMNYLLCVAEVQN